MLKIYSNSRQHKENCHKPGFDYCQYDGRGNEREREIIPDRGNQETLQKGGRICLVVFLLFKETH